MSEKPHRVQLCRKKGWRMPENTVKVDRTTRYGNPFIPSECADAGYRGTPVQLASRCVEAFRVWLGPMWRNNWDGDESEASRIKLITSLSALRGKNLACWCKLDAPCHADVLLELANKDDNP